MTTKHEVLSLLKLHPNWTDSRAAMTVYVDNMYLYPIGQFGRMKMSHMMADSTNELLEMADKIGVARRFIQHPGTYREHFDIALSKRAAAVVLGAKEITLREMAAYRSLKRERQRTA